MKHIPAVEFTDSAEISPCGLYRWVLTRALDSDGVGICLFVMLNPSTGDAFIDDATIRRCRGFAQRLGHGMLSIANLFSYRSTAPHVLREVPDPIGLKTDEYLAQEAARAHTIICAWGANGGYLDRDIRVMELLRAVGKDTWCLGMTKEGFPRHPLYLARNSVLVPYSGR